MRIKILTAAAALMLVAAACGDSSGSDTTDAPVAAGPTIMIAASDLGDIVTDGDGNTLYLFLADTQGEPSVCDGDCIANWPAFAAPVTAGDGIDASLLGTATRSDGVEQVTYNGWPLYYFAPDQSPGDANGQGVGDVWFVLNAAGDMVG